MMNEKFMDEKFMDEEEIPAEFPSKVNTGVMEFLSKTNNLIPSSEIGGIAMSLSNVICGAIQFGGDFMRANCQRELVKMREVSQMYGITLTSVLDYLEKKNVVAHQDTVEVLNFTQEFCRGMTTEEKMAYKEMENKHELRKLGIAVTGGVVAVGIIAVACWLTKRTEAIQASIQVCANSRQYQKTQRKFIKFLSKSI